MHMGREQAASLVSLWDCPAAPGGSTDNCGGRSGLTLQES